MMASHSVNLSELASFIDDMASFDATAEKHLRDLDRQVSRLHGMWEGAAADAHRAAHAELLAGIEQMRSALSHLRGAARIAHTNYGEAVGANTRMMDQVG